METERQKFERGAGVLLHPSSLPGPFGIGTLGEEARGFVDFLAAAGVGLWQTLPLGPTGFGDSPYQCLSAFAGNTYLIDPRELAGMGLAGQAEVDACKSPNVGRVDFGALFRDRGALVDAAWRRFAGGDGSADKGGPAGVSPGVKAGFEAFCAKNAFWLDDFALFSAIKETFGFEPWERWPDGLRRREPGALADFAAKSADRTGRHKFGQYLFSRQWAALRVYAASRGVRIIGDLPIFVAWDSADAWSHPELFLLDASGRPAKVAGVPPDYFTSTGQLWGNPLYDWPAHRREGYAWWKARIESALRMADILRVDHFRGFVDYWAVPAGDATAERGAWERGPGMELFAEIERTLGDLPIIAEDLGCRIGEVRDLRRRLGFPGMKILQFAFESEKDNADYPHNYPQNSVAYTGTHDNDTCSGWLGSAKREASRRAIRYVGGRRRDFSWNMIKAAWASPACIAIAPAQDLASLGTESRMNYPGKQDGYWTWRLADRALTPAMARRLRGITQRYFRLAR
ncbi:4-alpha-glucanotransferase [bacterium]|nr:4-alpha-glucanotransferase [bacterium]